MAQSDLDVHLHFACCPCCSHLGMPSSLRIRMRAASGTINTAAQIVDKYRDRRDARQRRLRLIFISREWIGMVPLRHPLIYAVHNSSVARTASVQYREASGRVCNLSVRRYTVSSVPFTPIEAECEYFAPPQNFVL